MKLLNPFGFNDSGRLGDLSLLLLRITFGGLMFLNHGLGKFNRLTGGEEIKFMDFMGLGPEISLGLVVLAEAVCAILIVLGLFTRLATIPLIITMLVAIFMVHWNDPFGDKEMALLYLIPFITLFFSGAGKYSIDDKIG